MGKKFLWLILALIIGAVLFFIGSTVLADLAGNPFSSQPATNIGAWYDETWEAVGFYNLEQTGAGASNNFKYAYTNNPTDPTVTSPYDGSSPGDPEPDLVVTEWDVTGHVHFSSGL